MRIFTRTFSYMKPFRAKYFAGSALAACEMLMLFAIPVVNRMLVEMITVDGGGGTVRDIVLITIGLLVLTPLVAIGRYWQGLCALKTSDNLKTSLFSHLQRLPLSILHKRQSGDYLLRVSNDADRAGNMFSGFVILSLLRFIVVTAVTMALLFLTDWRIAVLALVYNIICFGLSLLVNPYVNRLERAARNEIAASSNVVLETMRSLPIVRVFALGGVLGERYRLRCEAVRDKRVKFRSANGMAYGVMDIFSFSAQAVGFIAAIFLLYRGEMTLSDAVYTASLMALASDAMLRLSTFILWVQPPLVAAERIFEIMDEPVENNGRKQILNPNVREGAREVVKLSNVGFSYPDGTVALKNINLTIKGGEHVALVGGSGGGKTTLAQVIASLYEPDSGEIQYFGTDGGGLCRQSLRAFIAYVPQEPILFDGTVFDNIIMGKPGATTAEVEKAAREAGLDIDLHTNVGERGMLLSGGQRQRVAIARAMLKDAPLLILDEATSALDSETEEQVQKSLDKLAEGRTSITIAHRLSTIKNAHRVIALENGCIVESKV